MGILVIIGIIIILAVNIWAVVRKDIDSAFIVLGTTIIITVVISIITALFI